VWKLLRSVLGMGGKQPARPSQPSPPRSAPAPIPVSRGQQRPAANYGLIAIDIDGTLLMSNKSLAEPVIKAVRRADASGVKVVLSSARPPVNAQRVLNKLGLDTRMICYNGALVCEGETLEVAHHASLDPALALEAAQMARHISPNVQVRVDIVDRWYTDKDAKHAAGTPKHNLPTKVDRLENILVEPVTRLTFLAKSQSISKIRHQIGLKFGDRIGIQRTENRLLQLLSPGIDKAGALATVAGHYGVSQDRVMAIGDGPNDLEMMEWAGCSVAVANGYPEILEAAHHRVASNDRGGVAEAILKYVLNGPPTGDRMVA